MSEKNKNRSSKKWLISRMKTSGSKRRYVYSPDYADTRHTKKKTTLADLPSHESMSTNNNLYNNKINTDLLKRFLNTQIGKDWEEVYSEIIQRIPTKLLDYKTCIQWYVADKVEFREGKLWNRRNQHFIETNTANHYCFKKHYRHLDFYVDPATNKLIKIGDFKSRKATRDLSTADLRKYREQEQAENLRYKRSKAKQEKKEQQLVQLLKANKTPKK